MGREPIGWLRLVDEELAEELAEERAKGASLSGCSAV
jgi:hypothetical protein